MRKLTKQEKVEMKNPIPEKLLAELEPEGNQEMEEKEKPEEKNILREIVSLLVYAAIVFGCTFLIITFVGQRTRVSGPSMNNTLHDGDQLILEKISYRFHDPERFDIVVFRYGKKFYIKRVIGLPGETVQIVGGRILINGETYKEGRDFPSISNPGLAESPITLESGEYFVLGDNRNNSEDSRYGDIGLVKKRYIAGKLWFTISPVKEIGFLKG